VEERVRVTGGGEGVKGSRERERKGGRERGRGVLGGVGGERE
jgi:hypothetical protein